MKRNSKAAEAPAPPPASTPKTSGKAWSSVSQMYARITVGRRRETGDWSHSESEERKPERLAQGHNI